MKSFEHTTTIHFRQTDMAGVAYFNEAFNVFHDAYEAWVERNFGEKKQWFQHPEWAVPLRAVSCDYKAPLLPFENYTIRISIGDISNSTFSLKSSITKGDTVCADISTTHIFLNKNTKRAMPIPERILEALNNLR